MPGFLRSQEKKRKPDESWNIWNKQQRKGHYMLRCLKMLIVLIPFVCQLFEVSAAEILPGYVLYAPATGNSAYLVDVNGEIVYQWTDLKQGNCFSVHLKKNGNIVRPSNTDVRHNIGGVSAGGLIEEIDPDGNTVWSLDYASTEYCQHHNLILMPDENILAVAYEKKTAQEAEAWGIEVSSSPWGGGGGSLLAERIVEIDPTKPQGQEIVWMWSMWDHMVRAEEAPNNPQLFGADLGKSESGGFMTVSDWVHLNGFDYNEKLDQIVFSSRQFSEIYIIDHSTTTQEAATNSGGRSGKGGNILYRWGRPSNYGANGTDHLDVVHCPNWVPEGYPGEGNILMFSNQASQSTSAVLEIVPPLKSDYTYEYTQGQAFGPESPVWKFTENGFNSDFMSGCQRLSNGNTLACEAAEGRIREVSSSGQTLWEYTHSGSGGGGGGFWGGGGTMIARAIKYPENHPGIQKLLGTKTKFSSRATEKNINIKYSAGKIEVTGAAGSRISVFSIQGKKMLNVNIPDNRYSLDLNHFSHGTYIVKADRNVTKTISILR